MHKVRADPLAARLTERTRSRRAEFPGRTRSQRADSPCSSSQSGQTHQARALKAGTMSSRRPRQTAPLTHPPHHPPPARPPNHPSSPTRPPLGFFLLGQDVVGDVEDAGGGSVAHKTLGRCRIVFQGALLAEIVLASGDHGIRDIGPGAAAGEAGERQAVVVAAGARLGAALALLGRRPLLGRSLGLLLPLLLLLPGLKTSWWGSGWGGWGN